MQVSGDLLKSFCEDQPPDSLDLSYLRVSDLKVLQEIDSNAIRHLILDGNLLDDQIEFRYLPNLSTLSLNKNSVRNHQIFNILKNDRNQLKKKD